MFLDHFFRNCRNCQRTLGACDLFCDQCWSHFYSRVAGNQIRLKIDGLSIQPLLKWDKADLLLSSFIYGFKNGGLPMAAQKIATLMILKNIEKTRQEDFLIIPVPPSRLKQKDHAYLIASEVSKLLQAKLFLDLEWVYKPTKQRLLNRNERKQIKISLKNKEFIKPPQRGRRQRVIIIDDVVTTGATAKAVFKAIKGPKHIEVWCIACR